MSQAGDVALGASPPVPSGVDPGADQASVAPHEEVDLASLVPATLRRRAREIRAAWTRVDTWALAIIVAQLAVVGPVVWSGAFYIDDWRAQSYAAGEPFWPWIIESNGTHFAPGARTIDWLQTTYFPLDHRVAVVVTLGVRLLLGYAAWRLLRRLVGPRPGSLVALLVVVTTASLLPPTAWYRQSITALPVTIALLLATAHHVSFVRRPSRAALAGVLAWLVIGIAFLEKAVIVVPWLAGISVLLLPALLALPWRTVIARAAVPVVAGTLLVLGFLAFYLGAGSYDRGDAGRLAWVDVAELVRLNVTRVLGPGMLGGPWDWIYFTPYYGVGSPPMWLVITSGAVAAALAVVAVLRSPRILVGALVAFGSLYLAEVAVVAVGRLARVGPAAGLELRLWSDVLVMGILLWAVVLLGPRRRDRGQPPPRHESARFRPARVIAVLALVTGTLVNVGHSTITYQRAWSSNPAGDIVANLRSDLGQVTGVPGLVAVAVPDVVPYWVDTNYDVADLLAPLSEPVNVHVLTPRTAMTLPDGHLAPLRWATVDSAPPGPAGDCGYPLQPGADPVTILFDRAVPYFRDAQVRLSLLVSQRTDVVLSLVTETGTVAVDSRDAVTLDRGAYRVMWRVPNGTKPTGVTVSVSSRSAGLCISSANIAAPQAAAPGNPE